MTQDEIYTEARRILRGIEEIPLSRFTVREWLFVSRHCLREAQTNPNVIANFTEEDLLELIEIAHNVVQRAGPHAIH